MIDIITRTGKYGAYGGQFVPETLIKALHELEKQFGHLHKEKKFNEEFNLHLKEFAGRPTPLYDAHRFARACGIQRILLKREDLCHTGAHKINNCIGQALLAMRMGKKRIIAETGAGQHGVAVASVCAKFGLDGVVYIGKNDYLRQHKNVQRMHILGTKVIPVGSEDATLKEAINEAIRDWVTNVDDSFYLLGSIVGPHPYPMMVSYFQSIIGTEAKKQVKQLLGKYPDAIIACVGGGSNSIGIFSAFLNMKNVKLYAVEAGGKGNAPGEHAATLKFGLPGILHGSHSYLLQNKFGQVASTHSISAGLDYPGVGPILSYLKDNKRIECVRVSDQEALDAFHELSTCEGIIPALEPAHALAYAKVLARSSQNLKTLLINLSGRGDKDIDVATGYLGKGETGMNWRIR